MDVWVVSFITAYLSALLWTALPSIPCSLLLLALGCWCLIRLRSAKTKPYWLFVSGTVFGIVWIASVGHWTHFWQQSLTQTREPVLVQGQVTQVVKQGQSARFVLKIRQFQHKSWWVYQPKVRLNWYRGVLPVNDGDEVQLLVKLKPVRGLANEGGFDYQTWLFSRGIQATGYVVNRETNQIQKHKQSFRHKLLQRFYQLPLLQRRWLAALAFGDRTHLGTQDWELVQKTGIAHLIAISGLHLGLVASLTYALSLLVLKGVYYWCKQQHTNLHVLAIGISLVASLGYAALAGFSIPTLRAWLMMLIGFCLLLWQRHWLFKRFFSFSVFLFVVLFPLSPFGLSFWFSFAAILALGFIFWRWPVTNAGFNLKSWALVMLRVQLGLSVLMLPLVGWQFALLSLLAPVVNLLAVPLVTLLLVPLCLLAVLCLIFESGLALHLFQLADFIVAYGISGLHHIMTYAPLFTTLPHIPGWCWLLLLIALVFCLLPFQHRLKYWCLLLCLPSLSYSLPTVTPGWRIDILDVAQGLSVLITKQNKAYVYDTGAAYPSGFNMADAALLPLLRSRNIQQLDTLVLSHDDNDHAGSYRAIKNAVVIRQTISSRDLCVHPQQYLWQGLEVRVLWPLARVVPQQRVDNDNSCVLHISDGQFSLLLPGDISKTVEHELVALYGEQLQANVLVAAHHGSNTSTSDLFLQYVAPEYVVFSQGFMNRWDFPKPEVLQRVQHSGAEALMTSASGQLSFYIVQGQYRVSEYRRDLANYWYAN